MSKELQLREEIFLKTTGLDDGRLGIWIYFCIPSIWHCFQKVNWRGAVTSRQTVNGCEGLSPVPVTVKCRRLEEGTAGQVGPDIVIKSSSRVVCGWNKAAFLYTPNTIKISFSEKKNVKKANVNIEISILFSAFIFTVTPFCMSFTCSNFVPGALHLGIICATTSWLELLGGLFPIWFPELPFVIIILGIPFASYSFQILVPFTFQYFCKNLKIVKFKILYY